MDIEQYATEHSDPQSAQLADLYRRTHLHRLYPRMCCEPLQGRLLKMLTRMVAPRRILELGAFSGYSTLCYAEGMPPDAELFTIEVDDEVADDLRAEFDTSPWADRIHLHVGDALDIIPTLSAHEPWDMVFIDANKRQYADYYRLLLPRLAPGGYIIADNTLWSGKVLDTAAHHDAQSRAIDQFNKLVAADPAVEKVIIPLRDGLTIIRKKLPEEI